MEYQSEKIIGLRSILTYQCKMCKIKTKIYTENPKTETFPINKAAVHGCQAVGIGHTQLSELTAFLEIPTLSESSYLKIQEVVADTVHDTVLDEMKRAGEEEKKIAFECGDVDVACRWYTDDFCCCGWAMVKTQLQNKI